MMASEFDSLKRKMLKDPKARAEYERLGPEFEGYGGYDGLIDKPNGS